MFHFLQSSEHAQCSQVRKITRHDLSYPLAAVDDIYFLSFLFMALITFQYPYSGLSSMYMGHTLEMEGQYPKQPPGLAGVAVEDPKKLWRLMLAMWHRNSKKRPTASDVYDQLSKF